MFVPHRIMFVIKRRNHALFLFWNESSVTYNTIQCNPVVLGVRHQEERKRERETTHTRTYSIARPRLAHVGYSGMMSDGIVRIRWDRHVRIRVGFIITRRIEVKIKEIRSLTYLTCCVLVHGLA